MKIVEVNAAGFDQLHVVLLKENRILASE